MKKIFLLTKKLIAIAVIIFSAVTPAAAQNNIGARITQKLIVRH